MFRIERVLRGILTDVKPMERGWVLISDPAAWDDFRAVHGLMKGRKMGQCHREALPPWPEGAGRVLVFWAGRSVNELELREASPKLFRVYEAEPPDANEICQPVFVAICEVWALPDGANPEFVWLDA